MPPEQHTSGASAYRPTSLDYINLPNPIQPAPQSQKHPLNGTPRLENASQIKFILEPSVERAVKKQKTSGDSRLDLPKLPVRNGTKRLRIPPTLSGLHQPPPDAGLLPSINTEQPQVPPPRASVATKSSGISKESVSRPQTDQPSPLVDVSNAKATSASEPATQSEKPASKRPKRNKWTDEETECLLKGVARFGIGSWTKIKNCADYTFNNRTALDLKDRFRVCRPEDYRLSKAPSDQPTPEELESAALLTAVRNRHKGPAPDRVSSSTLKKLGIDQPFTKSTRRSRHGYSEEEDAALLKGFRQYGNSWASIKHDPALGLSGRQPTDLRDRMRNRYPQEYAKVGLALPAEKPLSAARTTNENIEPTGSVLPDEHTGQEKDGASQKDVMPEKTREPRRRPQPSLFSLDDLYLGRPFGEDDDDEGDNEPIILDRGILDWAQGGDGSRNLQTDNPKNHGINPMMTLKLPKPLPPIQAPLPPQMPANGTTSLPSVASLLPENTNMGDFELPSLMHGFGPLEGESRPMNTFPTLEELLSQPID